MSGTDPNGKWFEKKGDPTEHFAPDGSQPEQNLPKDLPKIPGITLHYEIARGGMGVVYSGRQDFLDRRVAVKFLSVDLGGAAFAQRFQREAKILAGISHPNIVGCHMADTTPEGQSYLVMEFCDGPPLKSWIADNGPVSPLASVRLIRSSAQALAHAFLSSIIHRDIKPENILLESVTTTCLDINFPFTPKIVDLGLARIAHEQVGEGLTSPGSVMGTPATMSPEQFDDPDSVDFRSDIYGLGCCLYEMLVGKPAFTGKKLTDIVLRKRDPRAPNPCDENPAVPAAVGAFTQRLLASNREDRPASYKDLDREAEELIQALQSQSNRTDTIVSGGFEQTVVSRPGPAGATSPAVPPGGATQPAGAGAGGTQAPQGAPKQTSPGMLNTGELDFLSAGGAADGSQGGGTAFHDGGAVDQSSTAATGIAPAGGSKKLAYIGVAVVAIVAAVLGVQFGMGGGKESPSPAPADDPNKVDPTPVAANSMPRVSDIKMSVGGQEAQGSPIDIGSEFTLAVDADDPDGDPIDYEWKWPTDAMSSTSQTDVQKATFRLDDGLPGVRHTVRLLVRDSKSSKPIEREFEIEVGGCPEVRPLIGWDANGLWEKVSGTWRTRMDTANPKNQGTSGRVRAPGDKAILRASVGGDPYWEWEVTLEPTAQRDGKSSALFVLKYGPKGYAVRCEIEKQRENPTAAWESTSWNLEVLERTPGGEDWRPLADPVTKSWVQQQNSDATSRGWLAIRRVRDQLSIEIGEFVQPAPVPGKPLAEPTIARQPALTVGLTEQDVEELAKGQLELWVTKARCIFRAIKR